MKGRMAAYITLGLGALATIVVLLWLYYLWVQTR
jgi:hypothetical protein